MTAVLLNTKQVRAVGKAFAGFGAQYTDKTSDKQEARRSVVWCFYNSEKADALVAHFKKVGVINEVTRTGTMANMWTHSGGIEYVRVKALLA